MNAMFGTDYSSPTATRLRFDTFPGVSQAAQPQALIFVTIGDKGNSVRTHLPA
jgi:hypothetical protein